MSESNLNLLKVSLQIEIDLRQDVRNKELKLDLAKKVEQDSGNNQNLEELKNDLFLARKNYANMVSKFDDYRNYPGYVSRDVDGKIMGASEDTTVDLSEGNRLKPIEESPLWQVSEIQEDGTEKIIGYSGG